MNEQEELANLLDAQKKINARIRELQRAERFQHFNTVVLSKGEGGRSHLWRETYRLKIMKLSVRVDTENGRYRTIAEDDDLEHIYDHVRHVISDLRKVLTYLESKGIGPRYTDPKSSGSEDK